jgi:hypothetical protein
MVCAFEFIFMPLLGLCLLVRQPNRNMFGFLTPDAVLQTERETFCTVRAVSIVSLSFDLSQGL